MTNTEKLRKTIEYALSAPNLPAEIKRALGELFAPESLALAASIMGVWALSHFFGIGEVVDVILVGVTVVSVGVQGMQGLADLIEFGNDVINAKSGFDLRRASEKLVRAFVLLGVETVVALLTRKAQIKPVGGKGAPPLTEPSAQIGCASPHSGTARGPEATTSHPSREALGEL